MRTSYAGSGAPGTFRVGFVFDWFATSGWLCDPTNKTAANVPITCGNNQKDSASHVGGFFMLNATPLSWLEGYASLRTYANSDSEGKPQLLQVLGDTTIGVKAFRPPKLGQILTFGGEAQLLLLNGAGDVGLAGGGTSALFRGLGSADFRKPNNEGVPFRANLNLAYKIDNSAALVSDVEAERAKAFTDGRTTEPITRIERFGLGINRVDFFQMYFGFEFPFNKVQPYLEYTIDIPVDRQNYPCHTGHVFSGDVCPWRRGPEYSALGRRRLRRRPVADLDRRADQPTFEHAFQGLSAEAAFDIGVSGVHVFTDEIAPQPPWTRYLGIADAFDTKEKPTPPPPPAPEPMKVPAPQTFVRGLVHEINKSDAPVAGAIVAIDVARTSRRTPRAADGEFLTRHLEPGNYKFNVTANGFKPGVCEAHVGAAGPAPLPAGAPAAGPGAAGPGMGSMGSTGPGGAAGPGVAPAGSGRTRRCSGRSSTWRGDSAGHAERPDVRRHRLLRSRRSPRTATWSARSRTPSRTCAVIGGAVVKLTDFVERQGAFSVTADGAGNFLQKDMPPGPVTIRVEASGYMVHAEQQEIRISEDTKALISMNKRPKVSNVRVEGKEIHIAKQIHFDTDSAKILGDSNSLMEEIADVIEHHQGIKRIEIQGHTDNTGTREHNQVLSDARANSVKNWLVGAGIDPGRLVAKGYGQDRPVVPNVTAANKARNRRVQFIIPRRQNSRLVRSGRPVLARAVDGLGSFVRFGRLTSSPPRPPWPNLGGAATVGILGVVVKVSDKVAVLRGLLDRVRANAREPGAIGPPSSGRGPDTFDAEAADASMRFAMRPPADDRWDHAPGPIDEPLALAAIDLPMSQMEPPAFDLETSPLARPVDRLPSDPPEERRDSGGVLLDLDPGELPEIAPRSSIPPLSPPPPSRLRAVDSAANADPEAMRFWLSALTTPKSSPPSARQTNLERELRAAETSTNEIETDPAPKPSERGAPMAEIEGDAVPLAPRVPRWSEPTPTPPMSSARGDTSSPALVAPASERVGRITNGPRSRRRSMRFRPRALARGSTGEGGSRWLRGAIGGAAGAAIGSLALRLLNPRGSATVEPARPAATAGAATAPAPRATGDHGFEPRRLPPPHRRAPPRWRAPTFPRASSPALPRSRRRCPRPSSACPSLPWPRTAVDSSSTRTRARRFT